MMLRMRYSCFLILFLTFSFVNSKTNSIKLLPDEKEIELVPSTSSSGFDETKYALDTNDDLKVKISCRLKVEDCIKVTLTIDTGKNEHTYCGKKGLGHIILLSHKNKMIVTMSTNNAPKGVTCLAIAVKSFADFVEPEFDSSEAGVGRGNKETNCSCGWTNKNNARIVGGKEAQVNEYSFPVVIVRSDKKIAFCGGSVITAYHILTAAHCTYFLNKDVPLTVGVGEHNLATAKDTNATQFIPVEKIIMHKEFNGDSKLYDIAILLLKKEIQMNKIVGPVCLPNKKIDLKEKFVTVMGWGLFAPGFQSNVLLKANLKIVDFEQCSVFYRKLRLEDRHQFCTFGHNKDTCRGDSGGPVVWLDPDTNRYVQIGIVSYGMEWATEYTPGVNTDVSYFIDWIQKTIAETKPSLTCAKK